MTRADDIQRKQFQLQKELESIQKQCTHTHQAIRWSADESSYKWECNECHLRIRYPTISEVNEYLS